MKYRTPKTFVLSELKKFMSKIIKVSITFKKESKSWFCFGHGRLSNYPERRNSIISLNCGIKLY